MVAPLVRTSDGPVLGRHRPGYLEFLGIPYAAALVGPAMFEPPRRRTFEETVRDARAYGATVPWMRGATSFIPEPENPGPDCCNLNVWTPTLERRAGLPVLVWIHGGGFVGGCNASPWYHGGSFAAKGVVVVAANYRLGPEGFLLLEDGGTNRGLADLVVALEWVQENVACFGGDPTRVTIAGQSAGGSACCTLFGSPRATGLFARVAVASAGGMEPATAHEAQALAEDYATALGARRVPEALASASPERRRAISARYLPSPAGRRPPWEGTIQGSSAFGKESLVWRPVHDGDYVPGGLDEQVARDALVGRALLVGSTRDEFTAPIARANASLGAAEVAAILPCFGADLEGLEEEDSPALALGRAYSDWRFRRPARTLAEAVARTGRDVYHYEFAWASDLDAGSERLACHGSDVPFVFGNLDAPEVAARVGADAPVDLADEVHHAWVRFVAGEEPWPSFRAARPRTMILDSPSRMA